MSVLCLSTIPLCFIGTTTSILAISVVLLVRGVGIGLAFVPAMSVAFAAMRPDQLSDATPQLNVVQRLGGAIGTAVLAVVLQRASGAVHTPAKVAAAFGTAYTWSLALSALALIPCVLLMRAERPRMRAEEGAAERAAVSGETGVEPLGRLSRASGLPDTPRAGCPTPAVSGPPRSCENAATAGLQPPGGAGGPLLYSTSDAGQPEARAEPGVRAAQEMETSRR